MSEAANSRWWEFYGVRYATGTVVGALMVYFIFSSNSNLKTLLYLPEHADSFGMAHLALLAAYGLAYCYIASAPVLVLHAARAFFWTPNNSRSILFTFLLTAVTVGLFAYCRIGATVQQTLAAVVLTLTFMFQARYIWILFEQFSVPRNFYTELINNRRRPAKREFIESYKHLREHGNSFLIVFFEFVLGFILSSFISESVAGVYIFTNDAIQNLFLVLFIWIIPPACIWAFGQKLEQSLIQGNRETTS
jgi:hypothetical protein